MIERCQWVNVSSGTGSPGCPGQSPESRKMVVVVVTSRKHGLCMTIVWRWRHLSLKR